ncbi:cache domain-containing sensor histidine kinase [Paenibacillus oceani]|uniref:Sensor histidine kinase n=1 Tax=Paenibacillus oceani TaxID=2772510 RepID=A0A927CE71_9BACL|nr:sensor histidine kinase [Paenibacillus oceani]MBD2864175.1 sensor histidine kinase [Paenibacillus oceani]
MGSWMKDWRLRPLLLLVFLAFTGILLLLTLAIAYYGVSKIITEHTSQVRLELLNEAQKQLTAQFREIEETGLAISTHPELLQLLSGKSAGVFEAIRGRQNVNTTINSFLYSKAFISSIVVYSSMYNDIPYSEKDRVLPLDRMPVYPDMIRLEAADSIWIGSHPDTTALYNQQPVITFLSKVYSYNGAVAGYLEVNVIEKALAKIFQTDDMNQESIRFILDSGGRLISVRTGTNTAPALLEHEAAKQAWYTNLQTDQNQGYRKVNQNGKAYLMMYSRPNHAQWRVVEMIPTTVLYRPVYTIRNMVLLVGLFGMLLSVPVAFYLSRRIIRPLPELLSGFKQMETGNFNVRMGENNHILEFKLLSVAFNRTNVQLHDLLEQLKEEHRAKREAEFAALQSQINPHFLYNTLDMINWMAATRGVSEISVLSTKLAKLFRISLSKGRTFIPLREELEHCILYMDLQQARFKDKFAYRIDVPPDLQRYLVPKLILQPFIENSIIHGFGGHDTVHPTITIQAWEVKGSRRSSLRIRIEDNGKGMQHEASLAPQATGGKPDADGNSGYGIGNVMQRIQLYFGREYGVKVESRDSGGYGQEEPGAHDERCQEKRTDSQIGVRAELTLPVLTSQEDVAPYVKTGGTRPDA